MISDTISKKVISIYDGRQAGVIKNVRFNSSLTKLMGYVIFDDTGNLAADMFLNSVDCFCERGDAVMIKNCNVLVLDSAAEEEINPLGKEVFDTAGMCLGKVRDIEVKGKKPVKLFLEYAEISVKDVLYSGGSVVVRSDREKRADFIPKKIKINKVKEGLPPSYVMNIEREEANLNRPEVELPKRYTSDMKSFMGRRATATVLGYNNELIVREGEFITDAVIRNAKKHNRISQLIFNSI